MKNKMEFSAPWFIFGLVVGAIIGVISATIYNEDKDLN
jgi:flagellar biosynthesis protein FliQ